MGERQQTLLGPLDAAALRSSTRGGSASTRAVTSTGKDNWGTPRPVLDDLDREFRFQLDAAATSGFEAFPGRAFFGPGSPLAEDSLDPGLDWSDTLAHDRRRRSKGWDETSRAVWLNPPYSKPAGRGEGVLAWHRKAWEESRRGHELTTVILCPPHPGRGWFHRVAVLADEVRVYRQRIGFVDHETGETADGNTQDSCLVIYRPSVPDRGWPGGPRWSWIDVPKAAPASPLFDALGVPKEQDPPRGRVLP